MIVFLMSILAALVLLLLMPAQPQGQPAYAVARSHGGLTPAMRRALLGGACVAMLFGMLLLAGAFGVVDRHAVAELDEAALSRLSHAVTQHATSLQQSEWTRAALVQQSFGAAMLAAFAMVFRNRRR